MLSRSENLREIKSLGSRYIITASTQFAVNKDSSSLSAFKMEDNSMILPTFVDVDVTAIPRFTLIREKTRKMRSLSSIFDSDTLAIRISSSGKRYQIAKWRIDRQRAQRIERKLPLTIKVKPCP